jgi:hypothetical protein
MRRRGSCGANGHPITQNLTPTAPMTIIAGRGSCRLCTEHSSGRARRWCANQKTAQPCVRTCVCAHAHVGHGLVLASERPCACVRQCACVCLHARVRMCVAHVHEERHDGFDHPHTRHLEEPELRQRPWAARGRRRRGQARLASSRAGRPAAAHSTNRRRPSAPRSLSTESAGD